MRILILCAMLVLTGCATTDHAHVDYDALRDSLVEMREAMEAWQAATEQARATADEALDAANAAQACCEANTERLERIFEESQEK